MGLVDPTGKSLRDSYLWFSKTKHLPLVYIHRSAVLKMFDKIKIICQNKDCQFFVVYFMKTVGFFKVVFQLTSINMSSLILIFLIKNQNRQFSNSQNHYKKNLKR